MKKILVIGTIVGVLVLTLGIAGLVYAQTPTPETPPYPGWGRGMMGGGYRSGGFGSGMMGGFQSGAPGLTHDAMLEAFASALDMTTEELQSRMASGETLWSIAREQGLSDEQIGELIYSARSEALAAMVTAGVITQEQANWMLEHMAQVQAPGFSFGSCHGDGVPGRFGGGRGSAWRWSADQ